MRRVIHTLCGYRSLLLVAAVVADEQQQQLAQIVTVLFCVLYDTMCYHSSCKHYTWYQAVDVLSVLGSMCQAPRKKAGRRDIHSLLLLLPAPASKSCRWRVAAC